MRRLSQIVIGALALATPLFTASDAQAAGSLEACGNISVSAEAECTVEVEGGCVAKCTPVNVTAACAADLKLGCDGMCTGSASAECTGSCSADCMAECEVKPAEFNCQASCQADCSADCSGRCAGDSDGAKCEASCKATCTGDCDASCSVTPAEADCSAKCDARCEGSCKAEANIDCQVECQADGYVECEAEVTGGCKTRCEQPEGALFCDGQYVDAGNNLEQCIAALKALLDIEVYAEGNAECSGNTCTAEGVAGCSCSADGPGDLGLAGALGLGFVVVGATRRRRAA